MFDTFYLMDESLKLKITDEIMFIVVETRVDAGMLILDR
jgi:hypothetical protein